MGSIRHVLLKMDYENKVNVLFTGYSRNDPENPSCMRANCTCSLIRTHNGHNIIVDTLTAWDGERIVEALKNYELQPSDIDFVVCTHGHSDHIGCNYLFTNARWHIVGDDVSHRDLYYDWEELSVPSATEGDGNERILELDGRDVIVCRTPGHTLSCVSVVVRHTESGCVGICGDLFERVEDIADPTVWLGACSESPEKQRQQRLRMVKLCTYIIPGHGSGFKVTAAMREKLQQDVATNNLNTNIISFKPNCGE